MEISSIPKWVWNTSVEKITKEEIFSQFKGFKEIDGYDGVMIVLWNNDHYMDEEYFTKYRYALECAKELDMKIILWDENGFPSGFVGGLLEKNYPQFCAKQLDLEEYCLKIGEAFTYTPADSCQGIVLYNTKTHQRQELKGQVNFTPQEDNLKIMVFNCTIANDMSAGFGQKQKLVDYLDGNAVEKLISLTHNQYYERFSKYFGETICLAFYDEPSFWHIEGGRIWTTDFAKKFESKYHFSPITLYPALWQDIGKDTAYARKMLFDFRAELYANEYIGTLARWCESHGIQLTGHQDQEEVVNPTPICGDLMKVFKHQHIPGVDEISFYKRGSKAYKIVTSAAKSYGKDLVMCELFGAMGEDVDTKVLMREALDMLAKGINFFVPHGTWYDNDPAKIIFPPELSFRSEKFSQPIAQFNDFVKKCCVKLQSGEHICDIAILYPIDDLQAAYNFNYHDAYQGGINPDYSDYLDYGEYLIYQYGQDFTFIHPENISQCNNYKAVIIPGMKVISVNTLKVLLDYKNEGGIVLNTGILPTGAVEVDEDAQVQTLIKQIFATKYSLDDIDFDIKIHKNTDVENGHISYIHKRKDNQDIYFVANSSDTMANLQIKIKGRAPINLAIQPLSGVFL